MRNRKTLYLFVFLIASTLALVCGVFLEIAFGNPQKSKYHYIFQKYYLKKKLNWPENYSGVWKEWDGNGDLMVSTQVANGVMHGEQLEYYWYSNLKKSNFTILESFMESRYFLTQTGFYRNHLLGKMDLKTASTN